MILKLLAPIRTEFAIISERPLQQADDYAAFWSHVDNLSGKFTQQIGDDVAKLHQVYFAHRQISDQGSKYQTLTSDSMSRSLHILEVHLRLSPKHIPTPDNMDGQTRWMHQHLVDNLKHIVIRVYDHHIALLEADISLDAHMQGLSSAEISEKTADLEKAAIALGENISRLCYKNVMAPLFEWLKQIRRANEYIDMFDSPIATERVMWVTRTIIFEEQDTVLRREMIHHWLENSGGAEVEPESGKTYTELVQEDKRGYLLHWLNYLIREGLYNADRLNIHQPTIPARPFCDEWQAMIYAQYYYATLDFVDSHLTTILAKAWAPVGDLKIDSLKSLLEYNLRNANLLLLQRQDNAKYYKRSVKNVLDTILAYWGFQDVLVLPVQQKITLCESRLQLLMQQEAAKSAIFTDMILLSIGITGIFSTFLGLAEFGRTMATDVELASYDLNSANLIEWLAAQPTDVILVLSLILSMVLAILYLFFRQRQTVS